MSEPSEFHRPGTFAVIIGDQHFQVPHTCPHRAGWLEHGVVNEQRKSITCPLHFSVFSLETGEQLSGPPCGRLEVKRLS
ncbi:Rieske 2Fe-2S domain-containing protein [Pseudomonas sp. SWRI92]|uniref:Rieske 2Fe-2S domain-containing protein n=1 Tax=Pseudomonas marvdashtae TaxID=2745500 RepID=A0A923FQ30_9PSED|nr:MULTISPECIES: Rieske 2Fe-2S domain-containing protein [Pseudomonas]MBC3364636.1 Rieske 2Fe-2S domain-containing protein [Pseudomonas sp. SWRI154]MBC3373689.1 Rieske 2Fe-2S domain-containing protein [Pseudomonas sp. SWRI92]MBV4553778.1 Rieske 2Fe-2S domain-containing protein [Pseudomonas marvdashtae]